MQFLGRPPPRVQALAAWRRPSQRGAFVVPPSPISLAAAEIGADVWLLVVAAAISVGLAVGSYENLITRLYLHQPKERRRDEDLCASCTGFGTIRCGVCYGTGIVAAKVGQRLTSRTCVACGGTKRERCGSCAGRGTTGISNSRPEVASRTNRRPPR